MRQQMSEAWLARLACGHCEGHVVDAHLERDWPAGAVERRKESNRLWHHRRHARGLCHTSGCQGTPAINPRTGVEYWLCDACRAMRGAR